MVNFGPIASVPERYSDRLLQQHNANITLMRTTSEENKQLGEEIGRKLSETHGQAAIMLPLLGVSAIDKESGPFDNAQARHSLFDAIRRTHGDTELIEINAHINDESFAAAAANKLIELMNRGKRVSGS